MLENTQKPAIRFDGFYDSWKHLKLEDLERAGSIRLGRGNIISSKDISDNPGDFPIYSSSAQNNGEMGRYGSYMFNKELVTWSIDGGGTVFYRPKHKFSVTNVCGYVDVVADLNCSFLAYQMGHAHNNVLFDYTHKAHPSVIRSLYNIGVTTNDEQEKIGEFLKHVDSLIALCQLKYIRLKNVKKSMLEKMFPRNGEKVPEIRFKGFTGDWEQRKLGDIAPLRGGYAFKSDEYGKEGVPIIRISNILSDGTVGADFVYYVIQKNDEMFSLYDGAAILAMSGATTGKVSVLHAEKGQKYYQNQRVGYFTPTEKCNYGFIRTVVNSQMFIDQLSSVLVAGAQPNVSSKEIDSFEFMIPQSAEEQKEIGLFFESLANLITLHQRELEKLKNIKKAFLEKMFI